MIVSLAIVQRLERANGRGGVRMKLSLSVFGTGHVGLVTATAFLQRGSM